jgi:REP element-mobilizing transposase RayT
VHYAGVRIDHPGIFINIHLRNIVGNRAVPTGPPDIYLNLRKFSCLQGVVMTDSVQRQPNRRSIRLQEYDYAQAGAYFVTICTHNRECLFGEIVDGEVRLNAIGEIVREQWHAIPDRFSAVELDQFVVMPNHIHGIFVIVGAPLAGAHSAGAAPSRYHPGTSKNRAAARAAPTVGDIIGAYKSLCVHYGLKWVQNNAPDRILGKLWQRNYWEHIVRDESEWDRIREYICNNPMQWQSDQLNPRNEKFVTPASSSNIIREISSEYGKEVWAV